MFDPSDIFTVNHRVASTQCSSFRSPNVAKRHRLLVTLILSSVPWWMSQGCLQSGGAWRRVRNSDGRVHAPGLHAAPSLEQDAEDHPVLWAKVPYRGAHPSIVILYQLVGFTACESHWRLLISKLADDLLIDSRTELTNQIRIRMGFIVQ